MKKSSSKKTVSAKKAKGARSTIAKAVGATKLIRPTKPLVKSVPLLLLRLAIGWLFLYSGLTKLIMDPAFNSAGYLVSAKTFSGIYQWFASPENITWVNFMNVWGQILIGAGLITGTFTRLAAYFGVLMMALYYFPGLDFPKVDHGFLVDDHVVYAFALLVLAHFRAGAWMGLDYYVTKSYKSWWI